MIIQDEMHDLETPTGLMRTYLYRPVAGGRYPGLIFFSEIFQQTGPIRRAASYLAGHGFIVAVPEIFHELNQIGTVLGYDTAGADKGNQDKISKTLSSYDSDTAATFSFLTSQACCTGKIGSFGICIGGHLAFRAALNPFILASACFYATDLHSKTLGKGKNDDSLARAPEIKGELLMVWGKQDPHIPAEGRSLIYAQMAAANLKFTWHEFNAAHAFIRDEGPRYDPELATTSLKLAIDLFRRKLGEGDVES
jgi:carboxymethylenebutenolidase